MIFLGSRGVWRDAIHAQCQSAVDQQCLQLFADNHLRYLGHDRMPIGPTQYRIAALHGRQRADRVELASRSTELVGGTACRVMPGLNKALRQWR